VIHENHLEMIAEVLGEGSLVKQDTANDNHRVPVTFDNIGKLERSCWNYASSLLHIVWH
jgi:hypothetical protein